MKSIRSWAKICLMVCLIITLMIPLADAKMFSYAQLKQKSDPCVEATKAVQESAEEVGAVAFGSILKYGLNLERAKDNKIDPQKKAAIRPRKLGKGYHSDMVARLKDLASDVKYAKKVCLQYSKTLKAGPIITE